MNILITGGASGLGASITALLAAQKDWNIHITYSRSEIAAHEFERRYPNVKAVHCDFNQEGSVTALVELIPHWDLDGLINNAAGPLKLEHFHKADYDDFNKGFLRDILPVLRITKQALRGFRIKKFGRIITILSSSIAIVPPSGWSGYVAGKAYLHSMSKSWGAENGKFNVTSSCISPSFMKTGLTSGFDERLIEQITESRPGGRLLTTEKVAESVLTLLNGGQQVNGENILFSN